ncbi:CG0192-related protein [Frondihabitans peucedani]|uniref:Maltokinase N-terminal cap domain-containing protein n=1 Tax=Frondihabitans peucedani TaxID=598626 RepID=A0ABP8E2C2_9MICO
MALLHRAELRPSKTEIIAEWARSRSWFEGDPEAPFEKLASFRFDDPEGEVGIETLLVTAGGPLLQVPLTYRGSPLAGGEAWLLGTMEHSVLGTRYAYDGMGDPAFVAALATAALTGGSQADEYVEVDGERVFREPTAVVTGSGNAGSRAVAASDLAAPATRDERGITVATLRGLRVALARVPGPGSDAGALASAAGVPAGAGATEDGLREVVTGTWAGGDPVTLAVVLVD